MDSFARSVIIFASCLALIPSVAQAKTKTTDEAQVQCKDGTMSKAGRGACSHHGGIAATAPDESDKASPSSKRAASEATQQSEVQCKDGTTSKAGRGACSHHGGVAATAAQSDAKNVEPSRTDQNRQPPASQAAPQGRAPAAIPQKGPAGQPTARCKDGTMSYSQHRSGTCSRHGGVAEWLGQ
jgi:Protein of unknown function (DUF3761)